MSADQHIPFKEEELQIKKERFCFGFMRDVLNTPVTPRENMHRALAGNAVWTPTTYDYHYLFPLCMPDNKAKGNVSDAKLPADQYGGPDMFGVIWEYEPDIGGSTVRPGNPLLASADEWYEKIVFPTKETIDSWDWEGCVANANVEEEKDFYWELVICTGFFERLISFMDFEEAAVAMIDPDQEEAVLELFDRLADLYIMFIDKFREVFPNTSDAVTLHDDWGHQRGQFFSSETVMRMLAPSMKRVVNHIHSLGMDAELHSCGKVDDLIPCMIEIGFQMHECQPLLDFDTVVPAYGDKILFHVPQDTPPFDAPEAEQRAAARKFAAKLSKWGNAVILDDYYCENPVNNIFMEELYHAAREA